MMARALIASNPRKLWVCVHMREYEPLDCIEQAVFFFFVVLTDAQRWQDGGIMWEMRRLASSLKRHAAR